MTPADLLAPAGPIEPAFFPGENVGSSPTPLETRLDTYIEQAYQHSAEHAFTDPEAGAKLWALHLTYHAAYQVAISRESSENTMVPVLGARSFQKDQRDALKNEADRYEREFNALVAQTAVTPPASSAQTRQIANQYEW